MSESPRPPTATGTDAAPERPASAAGPVQAALDLNTVELDVTHQRVVLPPEQAAGRDNWLKKAPAAERATADPGTTASPPSTPPPMAPAPRRGTDAVAADNPFASGADAVRPILPPDIEKRYLRVGTTYRPLSRPQEVAFVDKGTRLETNADTKGMADELVRIAQARGWDDIKVRGSEEFRREAWLAAETRGMHAKGYVPSEVDLALLARRRHEAAPSTAAPRPAPTPAPAREGRGGDPAPARHDGAPARDPSPDPGPDPAPAAPARTRAKAFERDASADAVARHPELAGAAGLAVATDQQARADGLSPAQREVVAARVRENIVHTLDAGRVPELRVRDTPVARVSPRRSENEQELSR